MQMISRRELMGGAITAIALAGASRAALASTDQQELVDKARITMDSLGGDPSYGDMRAYLARSVGCLIVPQLLKAGFIIGGSGGDGVLVGRRKTDGSWSAPAFYTLAAGSVGLQIGAQASEVVLVINNERGLEAIFKDEMKLGADASIAVGPVGSGVEAAMTTNFRADIYSYARAKGLFAGASLEGAGILSATSWNKAYYGRAVNPRDIVLNRIVDNAGANSLKATLARVAKV
ncbi:lipid-binding SYLF domain-containing protein [Zavarzinia sp.]|uniref:lipid-binding SYLF domain-containing protein n=1 Tax=Zavarzinia sp. TaxID=2027920 RepID=UPI003BB72618